MKTLSDIDNKIHNCNLCDGLVDKFPNSSTIYIGKTNDLLLIGEAPANNGWRKSGMLWRDTTGKMLPSGVVLQRLFDIIDEIKIDKTLVIYIIIGIATLITIITAIINISIPIIKLFLFFSILYTSYHNKYIIKKMRHKVSFYILFRNFTEGESVLRVTLLGLDWNLGWFYGVFILLLLGGIMYTIGAVLYGIGKKRKYIHCTVLVLF